MSLHVGLTVIKCFPSSVTNSFTSLPVLALSVEKFLYKADYCLHITERNPVAHDVYTVSALI